ncbi:MAG: hypothetical protein M1833_004554 [Piccolia ochrophora]|nr:MAG: hypothetical protein M1833_004554 [Piccolia ochrophora]
MSSTPSQFEPRGQDAHGEREVTPSSSLLQDLLREKKAAKRHANNVNRRRSEQHATMLHPDPAGLLDDRVVQSSPLGSVAEKSMPVTRRASGVQNGAGAGGMGAREMEEYISTLHKQNFDLKLELYHRRKRMTTMEQKLEETQGLEDEMAEVQEVNDRLLSELEKRDRAVEEAVGIICTLEEKIEALESDTLGATPSHQDAWSNSRSPDVHRSIPSSPAQRDDGNTPSTPFQSNKTAKPSRLVDIGSPQSTRAPPRMPSFLTSEKSSASALRSLYIAGDSNRPMSFAADAQTNTGSILSRSNPSSTSPEIPFDGLDSPRLSVLSESSFLSVYGDKNQRTTASHTEDKANEAVAFDDVGVDQDAPLTENPSARRSVTAQVQKWVDERDTPSRPSRASPVVGLRKGQFMSIGDVLQKDIRLSQSPRRATTDRRSARREEATKVDSKSALMQGPMFGTGYLPPTPDTMSTIDHEGLSALSSPIGETSLLDGTPGPARNYTALLPSRRPRSAGSLDAHQSRATSTRWGSEVDVSAYSDEDYWTTEHNVLDFAGLTPREAASQRKRQPRKLDDVRDIMFNGEGLEDMTPSRPPQGRSNQGVERHPRSTEFWPAPSRLSRVESAPLSPTDIRSASSDTATPTRFEGRDVRSPEVYDDVHWTTPNNEMHSTSPSHTDQWRTISDMNSSRASSRSRISHTPSPSKKPGFVSRLFGRTAAPEDSPSQTRPTAPRQPSSNPNSRPAQAASAAPTPDRRPTTAGSLSETRASARERGYGPAPWVPPSSHVNDPPRTPVFAKVPQHRRGSSSTATTKRNTPSSASAAPAPRAKPTPPLLRPTKQRAPTSQGDVVIRERDHVDAGTAGQQQQHQGGSGSGGSKRWSLARTASARIASAAGGGSARKRGGGGGERDEDMR